MAESNDTEKKARVKRIKYTIDEKAGTVKYDIVGSELEPIVFTPKDAPKDMQLRLMLHGAKQKGGDCVTSKDASGEYVDAATLHGIVSAMMDGIVRGVWTEPDTGILEAIANVTGQSMEDVRAHREVASDSEWKQITGHPSVKAEVDRLRAERSAKLAAASAAKSADVAPLTLG